MSHWKIDGIDAAKRGRLFVCSHHFEEKYKMKKKLVPYAVPTLFMHEAEVIRSEEEVEEERVNNVNGSTMDFNINLETLQQSCRVCLQKGELNIWDFKVNVLNETNTLSMEEQSASTDTVMDAVELVKIFSGEMDILELSEEFPLLCGQCLEDFRRCYVFHNKLKNATTNLKKMYNECLNQYIEEEHLIESPEGESPEIFKEHLTSEVTHVETEETPLDRIAFIAKEESTPTFVKTKCNRLGSCRSLDENSSLVVTQFIPSTKSFVSAKDHEDEKCRPHRNLLTVDCKAVEVKDVTKLESLENPSSVADNENQTVIPTAIYMCQYCPRAFAKSEFLTLHLQKSHICKFCTQPFLLATDLYRHLREVHTEHKCVVCQKCLSSSSNLRHHIKNVHRINLPAKMTLLDFIQTVEEDVEDEDEEYAEDQFDTSIYFSKTDDVVRVDDMEIN